MHEALAHIFILRQLLLKIGYLGTQALCEHADSQPNTAIVLLNGYFL
jgi:hypothetical protein